MMSGMRTAARDASLVAGVLAVVGLLTFSAVAGAAGKSHHARGGGAPVASFDLVGGSGLTGPVTPVVVRCAEPTLTGTVIEVIGTAPNPRYSVRIILGRRGVEVDVDSGSGLQFAEQAYTGGSVNGFNATRGASVHTRLTAAALPAGTKPPALPKAKSLSGSINCAGQTAGTSSITVSGTADGGTVSGRVAPVNVSCNAGPEVLVLGLVHLGTGTALVDLSLSGTSFSLSLSTTAGVHEYAGAASSVSVSGTGGQVDGAALEAAASGQPAHTLQVAGRVVCGKHTAA